MKALRISNSIPVLALSFAAGAAWGTPVMAPGLPHLQQVTGTIYRGAQPTTQGWQSLSNLGIQVVIDLRREGEDGDHSTTEEKKAVEAAGMRYVHIPMRGLMAPTDTQIAHALALLNSGVPVFVHCKQGKDRTGTVIACYRMTHQGWENKKALEEAKSLGMHWVELGMKRYISGYRPAQTEAKAPSAL